MAILSIPLLLGLAMATIDLVVLSMLKMRHLGTIKGNWVFVFAFIVYGCQSLIFYTALKYTNLINMNLMWDISSDVLVTLVGLFFFHEAITHHQRLGIILGFIALLLLK